MIRSVEGRKYEPYTKSPKSQRPKKVSGEEQSQEHDHHFSLIKNSFWQAKYSIPHTTVTIYGDCVKMCEDFDPNFGDKKN
jgi:hypothetical protein